MSDRILIVDDESDIALILRLHLEDAGYLSMRARDGIEALEQLATESFSLMLLDIRMPRMDGMEVLRHACERYPLLPVIMMTAHGSEPIAVEAMKRGACDYIAKPFNTEELLKSIHQVLTLSRTRQENRVLQQRVEEERQKTEAILQGMADLLVAVDRQGRVITLNRRGVELLGVSREEALGHPLRDLIKVDIPVDELPCQVVLKSGAPCLDVAFTLHSILGDIPMISSGTVLYGNNGEVAGSVAIARDISALKALEREKEDFVSMLSHDLKSPITAVVGSIDLVREGRLGPVNGEQKEYLESAIESCDEMVEMIDNLLDVHKLEAGKLVLSFRGEEPQTLIAKGVARFRSMARKAELTLTTSFTPELPTVMVDRAKFLRLLGNLMANALKFTKEGGTIQVSAEVADIQEVKGRIPPALYRQESLPAAGRYLMMTVRDSGVGVPEGARAIIFDRFVQAQHRRRTRTGGSGLGLAFCRKMMDAHGGFIWVESELSKGSSFITLFPLADSAAQEE
jgi:two-component system, OmpR family, phosphate regulon sensor histidine kinase PhoR